MGALGFGLEALATRAGARREIQLAAQQQTEGNGVAGPGSAAIRGAPGVLHSSITGGAGGISASYRKGGLAGSKGRQGGAGLRGSVRVRESVNDAMPARVDSALSLSLPSVGGNFAAPPPMAMPASPAERRRLLAHFLRGVDCSAGAARHLAVLAADVRGGERDAQLFLFV